MMDFQNRVGHKTGSGAPASAQDIAQDRKDRLRRLALETFDLNKDPYFLKNTAGQFECRLCLTVHATESAYLIHTQGRKHQTNLARRAAKEQREYDVQAPTQMSIPKAPSIKIGRPGYRITKMYDSDTDQPALLFEIEYPEIEGRPRHRFMSAFEQKMEHPPDPNFQFVLFGANPYETIGILFHLYIELLQDLKSPTWRLIIQKVNSLLYGMKHSRFIACKFISRSTRQ
ncbi:bifunctional SF3A2 domain/Zinc finger C2H2 superfamily/Matrin-U1-C [Babesia duncani]|uniref:Bifunctional SF3A2 domain/Zinc finger C2H2 superfamily/Matrin-U1-C n=1 Tax=Babesia duncani TaxID=323732 RepID=A0AAD9UN56_9APIC|nr:bifunctional SF3A2 domain/Zinc finger C2H2 superfamily/Matrin-U1-C [Babesia duncani]